MSENTRLPALLFEQVVPGYLGVLPSCLLWIIRCSGVNRTALCVANLQLYIMSFASIQLKHGAESDGSSPLMTELFFFYYGKKKKEKGKKGLKNGKGNGSERGTI